MPEVSVIIPCYNHGQYLDEAVDSVLNQTFQNVEIFVINDGSTDPGTIEKLRNYDKPKTTVIHIENQGPSAARNIGIARASCEYILTLDADDFFESTFLAKSVAVLKENPDIGVVACGVQRFGTDTKRFIPQGGGVKNFLAKTAALGNALFRKMCWEQAGGYDESMKAVGYEDWDFWIAVTKHGWEVYVIPEYLFHYRLHPVSRRTKSHEHRPEMVRQVVRNHKEIFAQYVDDVIFEKELKILSIKQESQTIVDSWSYRLGRLLFAPARYLKKWSKL